MPLKSIDTVFVVLVSFLLSFNCLAQVIPAPGLKYYQGTIEIQGVNLQTLFEPCFVEANFSAAVDSVDLRAVLALPHFVVGDDGQQDDVAPVGVARLQESGPALSYSASFVANRAAFRYQDPNPTAPFRDIALFTSGAPRSANTLIAFYWHASAGHPDPIFCNNLQEITVAEDMDEAELLFEDVNELVINNPF